MEREKETKLSSNNISYLYPPTIDIISHQILGNTLA